MRIALGASLVFALLLVTLGSSSAQQAPAVPGVQPPPAQAPIVPPPEVLVILIRTTMVAVHQANRTGNYTVLRDLGAPGFQAANNAAQLGAIFAGLRNQNIDLAPTAIVPPQLVGAPAINNDKLQFAGYFPTQPLQINFEMQFQPVNGHWRLFGISVNAVPTAAAAATPGKAGPASEQKAPPLAKSPAGKGNDSKKGN